MGLLRTRAAPSNLMMSSDTHFRRSELQEFPRLRKALEIWLSLHLKIKVGKRNRLHRTSEDLASSSLILPWPRLSSLRQNKLIKKAIAHICHDGREYVKVDCMCLALWSCRHVTTEWFLVVFYVSALGQSLLQVNPGDWGPRGQTGKSGAISNVVQKIRIKNLDHQWPKPL